ncbi:restriction endonuclease subunit S [Candidatus Saccharibacteria bacterium]|nr:restriction endonuclease subunit S [Candidatus Saccharibacteria bacterium]
MTRTVLLGDVVDFISRGITPKYTENGDFYVINQKCIRNWKVSLREARKNDVSLRKVSDEKTLKVGDILVCSTGVGTLGRVGQFSNPYIAATADSHVTIVRPDISKVSAQCLGYVLKSKEKEIELLAEGSTGQTELSRHKLAALEIVIPKQETQKKIAEILGTIDEKIELNRRMNETLEKMGQALFKKYFITNPDAEKWEDGTLSDLVSIYSGFAFKRADFDSTGKYGLVTIKNVQDGKFLADCSDHLAEVPRNVPGYIHLKTGDVLLSLTGNVGRVCIAYGNDLLLNQRVAKLSGDSGHRSYAYFLFRQKEFKDKLISMSRGTAQLNLSPVETKNIKIKIPPVSILEDFYDVSEPLFKMITYNYEQVQTLITLRDSLLSRLISGWIKV